MYPYHNSDQELGQEQRDDKGDPIKKPYKRSSLFAVDDIKNIRDNMERIANDEGRFLRDEGSKSD